MYKDVPAYILDKLMQKFHNDFHHYGYTFDVETKIPGGFDWNMQNDFTASDFNYIISQYLILKTKVISLLRHQRKTSVTRINR